MVNIDRRTIMDLDIPLPPLLIQQQLIREVEKQRNSLSALITHTQEEITLLKELRAATIADAVLGRVDVRTAAKP
jgi:type I restriction enzyme S subunit